MTKTQVQLVDYIQEKLLEIKRTYDISILEQAELNILKLSDDDIKLYYSKCHIENGLFKDNKIFKTLRLRLDQRVIDHIYKIQSTYRKKYDTTHSKRAGSKKNFHTQEVYTYHLTYSFCVYIWIEEIKKLVYGE